MEETNAKARIPKLSHDNYHAWVFRIRSMLDSKDLLEVLTVIEPEVNHLGTREEIATQEKQLADWKLIDKKARQVVVAHIEDQQIVLLKDLTTTLQYMEALKSHYQHSTIGGKVRSLKELFTKRFTNNVTMRDHIGSLLELAGKIREQGQELADIIIVGAIIASLPNSYDPLVTAMEAWPEDRLTIPNLKHQIVAEWDRRQAIFTTRQKSEVDHLAQTVNKPEANTSRVKSEIVRMGPEVKFGPRDASSEDGFLCHQCRKPGHFRSNCPMLRGQKTDLRDRINVKRVQHQNENKNEASALINRGSEWYKRSFNKDSDGSWVIDSGCTWHMCKDENLFQHIDRSETSYVCTANGTKMEAPGRGTISLYVQTQHGSWKVDLKNVLYAPTLNENLISVNQLARKGFETKFTANEVLVRSQSNVVLHIGNYDGSIYRLNTAGNCLTAGNEEEKREACIHVWHRRFAHRNLADIKAMETLGLPILKCDHNDDCEACIKGKMSRKPFPKEATPTEAPLDCIVSDVCGPIQVQSAGKKRYIVTFTDLYSRYTEVFFIREKSEVPRITINYIERLKTEFGMKPKVLRTDRGLEYLNGKLQGYLEQEGIKTQCTVGYAPEQNGVAERKNRTLVEAARSMISESGLPKSLWAEAVNTANYTFNRIQGKNKKSPYELFYGKKHALMKYREFGCDAYVMIPYEKRRKLDDKAEKMKFIGYDTQAKGYRMLNARNKIIVSREVRFLEMKQNQQSRTDYSDDSDDDSDDESGNSTHRGSTNEYDSEHLENENKEVSVKESNEDPEHDEEDLNEIIDDTGSATEEDYFTGNDDTLVENENTVQQEAPRKSTRSTAGKLPEKYQDFIMQVSGIPEPKHFKQAMASENRHHWLAAMKEELNAIEENETWELTDLPPNRKAIGSKWVYKTKRDEHGSVVQHKARLVAQGFSQKYGVDYDEVFAPVVRSSTFRMLLSVAGKRGYQVNHYDIKTAFLNGKLEEEIYMKQPPGFQQGNKVLRLKKSLYGLKQAARVWNETLNKVLEDNSYKRNETDMCLYSKRDQGGVIYLLIHVDDILAASNTDRMLEQLNQQLEAHFETKNLGGVKHYLGIDVECTDGNFLISQPRYIDAIVEEAGLTDAKPSKYPLDTGYEKLEGNLLPNNDEYRKLIGMLLYLTTNTRPDIAASVGILSKRVQNPRDVDLNEVKRVIRYIKTTRDEKLMLNNSDKHEEVYAYSDASYAEDRVDRRSTSGYHCMGNGGAISWCSRRQDIITLSSFEAEYVALTETCKEVTHLSRIAHAFDMEVPEAITIKTDSQSCIAAIKNHTYSNRAKHIDTRYHYIRQEVTAERIKLEYCPTDINVADMMTKPLGPTKMEALRRRAGLISSINYKLRRSVERYNL